MRLSKNKIGLLLFPVVAMFGLSSSVVRLEPYSKDAIKPKCIDIFEGNTSTNLLTSNGDFLGLYTTLSISHTHNLDVISFASPNGNPTTINGPWSSLNFTNTDPFLPTNTSAYNSVTRNYVCLISGEKELLTYNDNPMTSNAIDVSPASTAAPVFLQGSLYGIDVENGGYASGPDVDIEIASIDPQTGLMNGVVPFQFQPNPNFYSFTHESMSSATNGIDEIYFLSGSNLVTVTNPNPFNPVFCWIDLAPSNTSTNYYYFYGLEYQGPGLLLAIREHFSNGSRVGTDLIQIPYNTSTCTVGNIISLYDLEHNVMMAPGGWIINSEFYSTTYDDCNDSYYISSAYDQMTSSRLIEINIPASTHFEQVFPQYLFGIEWKQNPCPCVAEFSFNADSCSFYQFTNTSTGPGALNYSWDFDDVLSGSTNTSTLQNPVHQFISCGPHNVCLTINGTMCNSTICHAIIVTDVVPPVAKCKNGVVINLDANCVATVSANDIDDGSFDNCQLQSLVVSPNTFNQCGTFPVTLTVTDWCGNADICISNVQVIDNIPPAIICPADVYLTTTDPSCSMVVNGLQWITLTDNCGIPSVSFTITGASNYSGNGDASGLIFDQGTSFVTYTATDNCGNTSQCFFRVVLDCICSCPGNMIQNPGFSIGSVLGALGTTGQCNNWQSGDPLETNYFVFVVPFHGCCDQWSIDMFSGGFGAGASIFQTGISFLAGHHYEISYCATSFYSTYNTFKFGFKATNTPIAGTFNPYNCINCENIGTSLPPDVHWTSYTLPLWSPSQNWDVLYIYAIGVYGRFGTFDNICVKEVLYSCCGDEDAFIENTDNATNVYPDQETKEGVFEIGNLMECNSIEYVDWGDGNVTNGPITGNNIIRHPYSETGAYEVRYKVREFDAQDTSQTACFEHIFLDSIVILPDTCYCGTFSDMVFRWDTDVTQDVTCGNGPVNMGCSTDGQGYDLTGLFFCNGTICPRGAQVNWMLSGPAGVQNGTVTANPYFGITLLPSYLTAPGVYSLTLTGQCGNNNCPCVIEFVVDCTELCPCNPQDILAFGNAVDMGFSQAFFSGTCKTCFSPIALNNCETVEWYLNTITSTPIGSSVGNQSFCYTFPGAGAYTIIMVVNRKRPDGTDCETFQKIQQVKIVCQPLHGCENSVFANSGFNEGAVEGGLNSGGSSNGWTSSGGDPFIYSGQIGSLDDWAIDLSGNYDFHDVLISQDEICLNKDTVTIMLRGTINKARSNIKRLPQKSEKLVVAVTNGGPFSPTNCPEDNCRIIANIDLLPLYPTDSLDEPEWFEVEIPFDLRDWATTDSCENIANSVNLRAAVYVTNALSDIQGPDTRTFIQIDNFCVEGMTVATNEIKPKQNLRIQPNPNTGEFILELPEPAGGKMSIRILGTTGQVMFESKAEIGTSIQTIQAPHLPQGIYFIQVLSEGRVMSVNKFVKM